MNIELDKIFENYDFGYNLDFISAEDWNSDTNHFYRKIYLQDNSRTSQPISATFHIYMHDDGKIRELVVEMP